jgi:hypothetical protein
MLDDSSLNQVFLLFVGYFIYGMVVFWQRITNTVNFIFPEKNKNDS